MTLRLLDRVISESFALSGRMLRFRNHRTNYLNFFFRIGMGIFAWYAMACGFNYATKIQSMFRRIVGTANVEILTLSSASSKPRLVAVWREVGLNIC